MTFQDLILKLSAFWASKGCLIEQGLDLEVGAGMHPETLLRVLGAAPWSVAYVQPSRRPDDGRFGQNPNRLFKHHQMQVILKPSPDDVQQTYTYFLPGSDTADYDALFQRQVDNVGGAIARGVTAGNQLLFASPESGRLADMIVKAFEFAQAGSMNGVRVIFVGKPEDVERVKAVVEPAGATFVFVEMK